MKLIFSILFFMFLFPVEHLWAKMGQQEVFSENLRQSYHRLETRYAVSRVRSVKKGAKETLQNFLISGDIVLTPKVSLTAGLPFVTLGREGALTNPSLGLKTVLLEELLKGFPTFVFFNGDVKFPMSGDREFVFARTDVRFAISSLREVHHLSLSSDFSYILKLDQSSSSEKYGNELTASVGGDLDTGYQFSTGLDLNYRRAEALQTASERIRGRSLFILKPRFSYHHSPDMIFQGSFAMPLGRQELREALRVFGDYTIAGVGGNTLYLSFEKRF